MKERPILMSPPMVRATLDDLKTQTRRLVSPQPDWINGGWLWPLPKRAHKPGCCTEVVSASREWHAYLPSDGSASPYGKPGDRLWVKEAHYLYGKWIHEGTTRTGKPKRRFVADRSKGVHFPDESWSYLAKVENEGWFPRNSLFMPRWASRITLEVTEVRVHRLQDISDADIVAEGTDKGGYDPRYVIPGYECGTWRDAYQELWRSINGPGSWTANPWVWVIGFKRLPMVEGSGLSSVRPVFANGFEGSEGPRALAPAGTTSSDALGLVASPSTDSIVHQLAGGDR